MNKGYYERALKTGIFCSDCGAEQDQLGQTGHHSHCQFLKSLDEIEEAHKVEAELKGGEDE